MRKTVPRKNFFMQHFRIQTREGGGGVSEFADELIRRFSRAVSELNKQSEWEVHVRQNCGMHELTDRNVAPISCLWCGKMGRYWNFRDGSVCDVSEDREREIDV